MTTRPLTFAYEAMGTGWKLSVWDEDEREFERLCERVIRDTREFEKLYSRFDETSLVWQLAGKTGRVDVPEDLVTMLRWYERLYACSDGRCNPLVGFSLSDLGYDAAYSLRAKEHVRKTPPLPEAVRIIDDRTIELMQPALIDVGALGKGFFVDKIAAMMRDREYGRFLVDGSGDIVYEGDGVPLRVGLEHPRDPTKVIGVAEMTRGALCGSGANRRAWDGRHHIIDPVSLESSPHIAATWVLAESATVADALATCLFLTGPECYEHEWSFEYCVVNAEMKLKSSVGFPAELF